MNKLTKDIRQQEYDDVNRNALTLLVLGMGRLGMTELPRHSGAIPGCSEQAGAQVTTKTAERSNRRSPQEDSARERLKSAGDVDADSRNKHMKSGTTTWPASDAACTSKFGFVR